MNLLHNSDNYLFLWGTLSIFDADWATSYRTEMKDLYNMIFRYFDDYD